MTHDIAWKRNSIPETLEPMLHCYDSEKRIGCSAPDWNGAGRYASPTPHQFVGMRIVGAGSGLRRDYAPFYECLKCGNIRRCG